MNSNGDIQTIASPYGRGFADYMDADADLRATFVAIAMDELEDSSRLRDSDIQWYVGILCAALKAEET